MDQREPPASFLGYLRRHWLRAIGVLALEGALITFIVRNFTRQEWYDDGPWYIYVRWPLLVAPILLAVVLGLALPLQHWQREDDRRARALAERRKDAVRAIGDGEEPGRLSIKTRLAHAYRASRGPVIAAGVVELFMLGVVLMLTNMNQSTYGDVTVLALFFCGALPLWIMFSFLRTLADPTEASREHARAELAYREAVKDRTQLAGGLALDEHAGVGAGGELSMQAEAGGLELHEQVTLDLDVRGEEVSEQANEVVEERGR